MNVMKNQFTFLAIVLVFVSFSLSAQVRIGGGVSIDVSLDLPPIPEVIVVKRRPNKPQPIPRDRRVNIPVDNRRDDNSNRDYNHNRVSKYGEIRNQNGPYGLQIYNIRNAQIQPLRNGLENVIYQLDSGDVLELIIATANPQDYNYHFSKHRGNSNNNTIVKVLLNNKYLDLRDGSLSLQPAGHNGFHSVINLHSVYEGDFNGTINF